MDFLKKFFGNNNETSGQKAKERLKIVLIHDRADISPELLGSLRDEIVHVLIKYMEIDEQKIEINLGHGGKALIANIPVLSIKRGRVEMQ